MPYPETLVSPMRGELTSIGFEELTSTEAVNNVMTDQKGTALVVVNSVCGCAAGNARPGVKMSLVNDVAPDKLYTVFAGQDLDATEEARKYMFPYPPSSPAIALFKDGKLVHFIERHHIEGRPAQLIAENLKAAYKEFCN
ncbi:MAG: BrxA/BrxB family bacilliredoxin [Bacteroidetes bacterium]|nr:BrxA/BrxB family bacilliredoxin [Bacteroidota bacterium]